MTSVAYWTPRRLRQQHVSGPVRGRQRRLIAKPDAHTGRRACARAPASARAHRYQPRRPPPHSLLTPSPCLAVAGAGGAAGIGLAQRAVGRERRRALVRVARDLHAHDAVSLQHGPRSVTAKGSTSPGVARFPGLHRRLSHSQHTAAPKRVMAARPCMHSGLQLLHA